VSYDSPGADNEEFIELVVDRLAVPPPRPPADAAEGARPPMPACHVPHDSGISRPDAAEIPDAANDSAPHALTLADCGLSELRLVNGGAGACDEYRVIPLGAVIVPDDGFVLVCAQDSVFASSCDVNTAGRSAIRNGFLQNGPNDGFRFLDGAGAVALEVGYEGGPACFSGVVTLVDETGEASGAPGQDDVNRACDGKFDLAPASEAPLRAPNRCPMPSVDDGGAADAQAHGPIGPVPAPTASSSPLEFAPDAGSYASLFPNLDASFTVPERQPGAPPAPPSCTVSPRGAKRPGDATALLGMAAAVGLTRRKRRLRLAPRAGSSARFEKALRRSP
jgi:hypothetical protein